MGRLKKKSFSSRGKKTSCTKKQEPSYISHGQSQVHSTNHEHPDGERCPVSAMEESKITEIPSRSRQTMPSPRGDADCCVMPSEGAKLSSPTLLESRCLKVTFNPEKCNQSRYKDETTRREMGISPHQQPRSSTTPSKDDVLSVVIEKLTELVNDSERRQSQSLSGRSTPSGVCGSSRQEATQKSADPLYKCSKCSCLFAPSAKLLRSKEAVLCQCCEKAQKTIRYGARDGCSSSEEQKVKCQQTGYTTTKDHSNVKCELCSHVAGSYEDLLYHLLSEHADAKICKCKLCDFFTTVKARIQDHAAVHIAPHVYKCSSCPFVTDKLINLQGHMKNHNKDRELLLKCSECGFSCRCEDVLRTHMWEHVPSIRNTSTKARTPNPREVIPTTVPTTSKPPSVPSPALATQTIDVEQPYIFKCLLCGYLCDRLATLKAHAWRHAGEKGCSYPVVDKDKYLKRSLSSTLTTASPSAGKLFPLGILSSTKLDSGNEMPKGSSSCDGVSNKKEVTAREPSQISRVHTREICHGPGDSQEEASSCHCEGINIPPSSVPFIKELLDQKKHENDSEVGKKAEQDPVSSVEAENQSSDPSTLHISNSSLSKTRAFQTNDVAVNNPLHDGYSLEACQNVLGKQSQIILHNHQVLVIDPSDPPMLFANLDMPIPEPAAMVEAITEYNPAIPPERIAVTDNAFIPPANKFIREQLISADWPQSVTTIFKVSSSQTCSVPMSLQHSEELTEISSQFVMKNPKTVQECREKISQHVCKEIGENLPLVNELRSEVDNSTSSDDITDSELDTDKNLKIKSGIIDSFSSTVESSSQSDLKPGASQTKQGQKEVNNSKKPSTVGEKRDDAWSTEALKSQEKLTQTLIYTATGVSSLLEKGVSGKLVTATPESGLSHPRSELECEQTVCKESALPLEDDTMSQSKQEKSVVSCLKANIDSEESTPRITKQGELIQEKQINNKTEIAPVVSGHKRGADLALDESIKGVKRICPCDKTSNSDKNICHPVINQGITTQNVGEGQVGSEKELEKYKISVDTNTEEDSIVKFFMNIIEGSGEPFQCKLCNMKYETYNFLKQHLQTHLVHNSFRCPLCKECFESLDSLKYHIQEHYQESHSCSECSAFFSTKSELQAHRQSHTALKVCDICNATFSGQAEYTSHQENVHNDHGKSHIRCTHCGEDFRNTNTLLQHTLYCTMRKMRSCKECSFASETTKGLQDHIKDCHLKAKFYKCTLCDYKSSAKNGIKNHMKFHTTDRPYRCELCNFTGAYPQSLRSHMRMHTQPDWRPDCLPSELPEQYRCKLCCYTCNYLPSLKSHMWRHASDPNCSYKGKQSTSSNAPTTTSSVGAIQSPLITSKQQSTSCPAGQGPQQRSGVVCNLVTFCCQECGFQSTDRSNLVEHLKTHIPTEILEAGSRTR